MEFSYPHDRTYKPQGFRPNLFQPASSARENTDPRKRSSKKTHLHGLHHHHHHNRHHRSRHAKEAVQSAIQLNPPTSFGDLLKQAGRGKEGTSPDSKIDDRSENADEMESEPGPQSMKPVYREDVEREKKRANERAEDLRSSLQLASEQSLKASRRLDDTYYSILEKVSVLRQTIGSLQELSGMTKELHENFQADTNELLADVQGQFEGLDNFEAQQQQVKDLKRRIDVGKDRANALTQRLEEARSRVGARAKVEAEGEARKTRRIRVLWGILGTIALLILVAIVFQQLRPTRQSSNKTALNFEGRQDSIGAVQTLLSGRASRATSGSSIAQTAQAMARSLSNPSAFKDDGGLRMFDEL